MLRSRLLAVLMIAALPLCAEAQARPSAAEAQALLQARPELVQQLRQRIITSGMTAELIAPAANRATVRSLSDAANAADVVARPAARERRPAMRYLPKRSPTGPNASWKRP